MPGCLWHSEPQDGDCPWEGRKGSPGKTPPLGSPGPAAAGPGEICETLPIPKGQKAQAQSPPKATQSKTERWVKCACSLRYPWISKIKPQRFCVQLLPLHRICVLETFPVQVSCLYLRLKPAETKIIILEGCFLCFYYLQLHISLQKQRSEGCVH